MFAYGYFDLQLYETARHVRILRNYKVHPYLLQYEFSWIWEKFFMDFFTRLLAFWNFERRFSNLEAVLYMTMTPAYSKSARARSQNNYY